MLRAGAEVDGYGVFHGGLETPEGQDYAQTQGKILVLHHGADDPVAPMEPAMVSCFDQEKPD